MVPDALRNLFCFADPRSARPAHARVGGHLTGSLGVTFAGRFVLGARHQTNGECVVGGFLLAASCRSMARTRPLVFPICGTTESQERTRSALTHSRQPHFL